MKKKLFVIFLLTAVLFTSIAKAEFEVSLLDQTASNIAKRSVVVKCRNKTEDSTISFAWGYVDVPTGRAKYTVISDDVCLGALAIDLDVPEINEYMKIMGVTVLTHEAFHLKRIRNNDNEAITQCRAMRHYDKTLLMLGAEEETLARLMQPLIINHYIFTYENRDYYLPSCRYPERYSKWGIVNQRLT